MVKCERSYPAPKSLDKEKLKGKNGKYNSDDVITRLMDDFHGKCYICEMKEFQDIEVEHLLPHHQGADLNRKFDWDNLFLSCSYCNNIKNQSKYEGVIINCCTEDPEEHIECIFMGDGMNEVVVRPRDEEKASLMTAQLIDETFNLVNTPTRKFASIARKEKLKSELGNFFCILRKYQSKKSKFYFGIVKAGLRRETQFAAFKRDYIRLKKDIYPEFQKYV